MSDIETTAKRKTVYTTVTMDDGRIVEFAGKQRIKKELMFPVDALPQVRLDFLNGETRLFSIPEAILYQCAAHGAGQKLVDEVAGVEDLEDAVQGIDELMDRLSAGDWLTKRESSGLAGASVLCKALVELTGKAPVDVRADLKSLSTTEKNALRNNPRVLPIVQRLEANKKVKVKPTVDTEALLGRLGLGDAPEATI